MRPLRTSFVYGIALLLCASPADEAFAQRRSARQWEHNVRTAIDNATRTGGLRHFEAARRLVTRAVSLYPDDPLLLHYEGFLLYRMITIAGNALSPSVTETNLDEARVALEHSLARRPMAESYLLLSEIYDRQIAADPARATRLERAMALARARAMAIGASNPRIYLLAGIAALDTRPDEGGGPRTAEKLLRAAVTLFARDNPRGPDPAWGRAEAHAWLGKVYERTERKRAAAAEYAKALAIEPDYAWVRDELLPSLR